MDEITFTEEQQELVNKRIAEAKHKERQKVKDEMATSQAQLKEQAEREKLAADGKWQELVATHEARISELEPFQAQAEAYQSLIEDMLKSKIKDLGDAAKTAIAGLPESLSALDKLNWLNKNAELFTTPGGSVGTPARRRQQQKQEGSHLKPRQPIRL